MGSLRTSMMKQKEEQLTLFLEMRKRERERNNFLLQQNSEQFDAQFGTKTTSAAAHKNEFPDSDVGRNDYDWLMTPPSTPVFPSLETEAHMTLMSQLKAPKAQTLEQKSRLAKSQAESAAKSNLTARQPASSPGNTSSTGTHRPSSSGGSRPVTPTGRPTLGVTSRSAQPSASRQTINTSSKQSKPASPQLSKPARSTTPNSRSTVPSAKPTVTSRSSMPTARSSSRSSTPPTRASIPLSKSTSGATTPTRRSSATPTVANISGTPVRSPSSSSVPKKVSTTTKNPAPPRSNSPTMKPKSWKPEDMSGFLLDAPPNLLTSLPERPISANRGRPGVPSVRSTSVEPLPSARVRRQSSSPSRGRPPNGAMYGSSVPALNRLHAKANDNISPALVGTKTVERVINMRRLVPPKQDDKHSPHSNLSGKSSSPESSGFGRTLSRKSLDMAIRHMDISQRIPGNLRPLMSNIPASSMYSVRSGPTKSRMVSKSGSPVATSSNASTGVSVDNQVLSVDASEMDENFIGNKGTSSPARQRGR